MDRLLFQTVLIGNEIFKTIKFNHKVIILNQINIFLSFLLEESFTMSILVLLLNKQAPNHHFLLAWPLSGGIDKQTGNIHSFLIASSAADEDLTAEISKHGRRC